MISNSIADTYTAYHFAIMTTAKLILLHVIQLWRFYHSITLFINCSLSLKFKSRRLCIVCTFKCAWQPLLRGTTPTCSVSLLSRKPGALFLFCQHSSMKHKSAPGFLHVSTPWLLSGCVTDFNIIHYTFLVSREAQYLTFDKDQYQERVCHTYIATYSSPVLCCSVSYKALVYASFITAMSSRRNWVSLYIYDRLFIVH